MPLRLLYVSNANIDLYLANIADSIVKRLRDIANILRAH